MTHDELVIEVQRLRDMVQTLSESHDQNRRELQFATRRAEQLTMQLESKVVAVDDLLTRRGQ